MTDLLNGVAFVERERDAMPSFPLKLGNKQLNPDSCAAGLPMTGKALISKAAAAGQHAKLQGQFTSFLHFSQLSRILNSVPVQQQALMVSQCQVGAASWLRCAPFTSALTISGNAFVLGLIKWLGRSTPEDDLINQCSACASGPGGHYDHTSVCPFANNIKARHDKFNDILINFAVEAGVTAVKEPRGYDGFGQGGPDAAFHNFPRTGCNVGIDCTMGFPAAAGVMTRAARNGLAAARHRVQDKQRKFGTLYRINRLSFVPAAIETTGALGKETLYLVKQIYLWAKERGRLSRLVPVNAPWTSASPIQYWMQQVSVMLRNHAYEYGARLATVIVGNTGQQAALQRTLPIDEESEEWVEEPAPSTRGAGRPRS
jgi:hypothetical protein